MALLDQLFGTQQPQDSGGLVQSILSQRFQPQGQDVDLATAQSAINRNYVSPYAVQQQRMALPMAMAGQLGNTQLQGTQIDTANLNNQMLQARLQYMQQRMGNNGNQPPVGFQQGQGQPQQNDSLPPVGFNNQPQSDPRYNQAINDAWMLDPNQVPKLEQSQIENDPNVVAKKSEAGKSGETAADSGKTLHVMSANLPVVMQRLQEMEDAVPNASYGLGVNNEGTGFKQQTASQFGYDKSNAILQQRAAQGVLPELGPQLAQAGIRGNKFLETLASSASGLNLAASPEAKTAAIQGLREQYISNLKSTARQVRSQGGQAPSDADIDAQVAKFLKDTGNTTGAPMAKGSVSQRQQPAGSGLDQSSEQPSQGRLKVMIPDGKGGFQTGTIDASHKDTLPLGTQVIQ